MLPLLLQTKAFKLLEVCLFCTIRFFHTRSSPAPFWSSLASATSSPVFYNKSKQAEDGDAEKPPQNDAANVPVNGADSGGSNHYSLSPTIGRKGGEAAQFVAGAILFNHFLFFFYVSLISHFQ
jgi:hypothetical protein